MSIYTVPLTGVFEDIQSKIKSLTTRELTHRLLRALDTLADAIESIEDRKSRDWFRADIDRFLASVHTQGAELAAEPTDELVVEWVGSVAEEAQGFLTPLTNHHPQSASNLERAFRQISNEVSLETGQRSFQKRVALAQEEVDDASESLRTAVGEVGSDSFASHFAEYAGDERRSASSYRVATIISLALTTLVAIYTSVVLLLRPSGASASEWTNLISHLVVVAALGALTAYLGRQAGQHRRLYNWAKSIEVQLKAFPALIAPLSEEHRMAMYTTLSKRVLGAVPEKGIDSQEEVVSTAQVLDLVLAAIKKSA